jgi:hypothetical protein
MERTRGSFDPSTTNSATGWVKSTFSGSGNCVEWSVEPADRRVQVRDSKDPDGAVLTFTMSEWSAFVEGVKNCEADL